jgi:hypothetical protein
MNGFTLLDNTRHWSDRDNKITPFMRKPRYEALITVRYKRESDMRNGIVSSARLEVTERSLDEGGTWSEVFSNVSALDPSQTRSSLVTDKWTLTRRITGFVECFTCEDPVVVFGAIVAAARQVLE